MTRLLYWDPELGDMSLTRMTDTQMETVAHLVQVAHANNINNLNGVGRFFLSSSQNAGSATDTRRFTRSGPGNQNSSDQGGDGTHSGSGQIGEFPGTGTQTVNIYRYRMNNGTDSISSNIQAPLYWNGSALQRSTVSSLSAELFPLIRSRILNTSNALGSYRIQTSSPGTGWVNKGTAFIDSIFGNSSNIVYTLWFKATSTVATPSGNPLPVHFNNGAIQRSQVTTETSDLINHLRIQFSTWSHTNGLFWEVGTSLPSGATQFNTFVNQQLNNTSNVFSSPDTYTSTPVGNATTITTYRFYAR